LELEPYLEVGRSHEAQYGGDEERVLRAEEALRERDLVGGGGGEREGSDDPWTTDGSGGLAAQCAEAEGGRGKEGGGRSVDGVDGPSARLQGSRGAVVTATVNTGPLLAR
jgi:hypothetical protein